MNFRARDDAAGQRVAYRRLVQLERSHPGGFVRLRPDGVNQKRFAQILRRFHVGPWPLRDDAARERFFRERALPAHQSTNQEHRRRCDDENLEEMRKAWHEAQRRRACERVERHERAERGDGEHQMTYGCVVWRCLTRAKPGADSVFKHSEDDETHKPAGDERDGCGHRARNLWPKKQSGRDRIASGQECRLD